MVKIRVQDNDEGFSATDIFNAAIKLTHTSHAKIATMMGWSRQSLNQKVTRKTLRADEFLKCLSLMGIEMQFTDTQTGRDVFAESSGYGYQFRGNCNGVTYDTATSKIISSSFFKNGSKFTDGMASELYIDKSGRYFRVDYYEDENQRAKARAMTSDAAAEFIAENGTKVIKDET